MKRIIRGVAATLALLLAAAVGQELPSGGEEAKLQEELQGVLKKLREERAAHYQRARARTEEIEAAKAPVRRLEGELVELRSREQEADKNLAEVRADLERMKADETKDPLSAMLAPEVEKLIKESREFIEAGVPYRKADRLQRLGVAGEGPLSDQLGRYWSFLQEEARVARSGETYSAEVPIGGGKVKPARIFRVGHLVLGYVTEDGEQSGLWDGKEWAAARSPEEDRALRNAVDTLDRRRAPTLLPIPLLRKVGP